MAVAGNSSYSAVLEIKFARKFFLIRYPFTFHATVAALIQADAEKILGRYMSKKFG